MAACDVVKNSGVAHVEVFDSEWRLQRKFDASNLVVDSGLAWIAARTTDSPPGVMTRLAGGSNATAPVPGHTALVNETGRVLLDARSTTGKVTTYTATLPAGTCTGTVAELGIFNEAGTMLNRVAFTPEQKGPQDIFRVTWSVTQSA